MPTPFDALTADDARALIAPPTGVGDDVKANSAFYDGDHWQDGKAWFGPGAGDTGILPEVKKAFVSKNVVREVCERHMAGVVGIEPRWAFAVRRALADGEQPAAQEQELIDEAEAVLTEWWDSRRAHLLLQAVATRLALAPRAVLRLYVPRGLIEDGTIPQGDLRASLNRIYAHVPEYEQAGVALNDDTQQPIGVYVYTNKDKQEITELSYRDGDDTVLRVAGQDASEVYRLPFGGQLPLYQAERDPLITPQARQQQALLNMALTMLGRNVILGGFLERIILNAEPPGEWVEDAATGQRVFAPAALKLGAGTTNFLTGAMYSDSEGKTQLLNPSVVYRDPVPVQTFLESSEAAYRGILEETRQIHAVQTGAFNISGESRKQARADFMTSLLPTKAELDRAGRWLLETLLAMAAAFSGQPGRFAPLRVSFDCLIDLGPIPADELGEIINQVNAGLRSKASAMTSIGIADPDAEAAAIAAESEAEGQRDTRNGSALLARAGLLAQDATQQSSATGTQTTGANGTSASASALLAGVAP